MNLKSVKVRILSLVAVVAIVVGLAISLVSIPEFGSALTNANLNQLNSIKEGKKSHIEDFLNEIKNLILVVSKGMINDIENINEISSSNARVVEEVASASEHLAVMTTKLNHLLEQYKT